MIGTGGLGHVAVQILRALTPARVIALDVDEAKLDLARAVGAHEALLCDGSAAGKIREMTDGRGAQGVFGFVGVGATVDLARQVAGTLAEVSLVGIGGGALPVTFQGIAYDAAVRAPYWGSRGELIEVLDLARAGAIDLHVERHGIDEAPEACARLHDGKVEGRAVVVPG